MVRQDSVEHDALPRAAGPAGVWTPWRRGEHASSARSLLLTLLGEFVLPDGGWAWTSSLLQAMAALDVEPKTGRQAIARTAAAGLLASERAGRQVSWGLTPRATRLLTDGTERIYQFGRNQERWDGRWLLLLLSVPEANRHLRHRLRVVLAWQSFANIGPGAWVSPWAGRERAAMTALEDLGLDGETLAFVGESPALEDRVHSAWDVAGMASEYKVFIEATEAKTPTSALDSFVALTTLVHDWRHFPSADPGLPDRLLPRSWPGRAATELFHDRHRRWRRAAWDWWGSCGAGPDAGSLPPGRSHT